MVIDTHATVEIAARALTVLVSAPATPELLAAYPVELAGGPAEIADTVEAICDIEKVGSAELTIAGLEFSDPEQHNTTVTMTAADLASVQWYLSGKQSAQGSTHGLITRLALISSVEVPFYA